VQASPGFLPGLFSYAAVTWGGWQQVSAAQSLSKKRERGEERRPNGEIKSREAPEQKCIDLSEQQLHLCRQKQPPNYRFFFLAKIAFQLSL
jgi:hypothetical protein